MTKEEVEGIENLLKEGKGTAEDKFRVGYYYFHESNIEKAVQFFRKAADNKHAEAYLFLGIIHERRHEYTEALKHYQCALERRKDSSSLGGIIDLLKTTKINSEEIDFAMDILCQASTKYNSGAQLSLCEFYSLGILEPTEESRDGKPKLRLKPDYDKALEQYRLLSHNWNASEDTKAKAKTFLHIANTNQHLEKARKIVTELSRKSEHIPYHLSEAKETAGKLINDLLRIIEDNKTSIRYSETPEWYKKKQKDFTEICTTEIIKAIPVLERDLNWGDYLVNLVKKLASLIISLGDKPNFFPTTMSESEKLAREAYEELTKLPTNPQL